MNPLLGVATRASRPLSNVTKRTFCAANATIEGRGYTPTGPPIAWENRKSAYLEWGQPFGETDDQGQMFPLRTYEDKDVGIASASFGHGHAAFALEDGSLYIRGVKSQTPYVQMEVPKITVVSSGAWHTVCVSETGELWSMGWGGDKMYGPGAHGHGAIGDVDSFTAIPSVNNVVDVQSGDWHNLALTANGEVLAWGRASEGVLGNGSIDNHVLSPASMLFDGVTKIGAGRSFSVALREDGSLHTWGSNDYGQLGLYDPLKPLPWTSYPEAVPEFSGTGVKVTDFACGSDHIVATTDDGRLMFWGNGRFAAPSEIKTDIKVKAGSLAAGDSFSAFICADEDELVTFGDNDSQCLGFNTDEEWVGTPTRTTIAVSKIWAKHEQVVVEVIADKEVIVKKPRA